MNVISEIGHFPRAVRLILEEEGVLNTKNLRHDRGGLTKYGISQKAYPNLDIANLTVEQAKGLYLADYWLVNSCHQMPWWAALIVFDCGVNQGVAVAADFIQTTVGVKRDGIVGPKTVAAIRGVNDIDEAIAVFQGYRGRKYGMTDTFVQNGRGWMTRLARVAIQASKGP